MTGSLLAVYSPILATPFPFPRCTLHNPLSFLDGILDLLQKRDPRLI